MARQGKHDAAVNYDEDLDQVDLNNYKGIFYDDPGQKYQDELTGAHFEYHDMCNRLRLLRRELPEDSSDTDEGCANPELGTNVRAFQKLQNLLRRNKSKTKEGRNGSQALPQQGYCTAGSFYTKTSCGEGKKVRQFSSQFGPHKDKGQTKEAVPFGIQGSNRCKSTDKQRAQPGGKELPHVGMPPVKPLNPGRNFKKKSYISL